MPRFVVLRHETSLGPHFDLMLEAGDVLKTWSLPQTPEPGVEINCTALADHRPAFLAYEGPLSGERGSVTRYDRGEYHVERQSDTEWALDFAGEKFAGRAVLRRLPHEPDGWTFLLRAAL